MLIDNAVTCGGLVFSSDWRLAKESLINRNQEDEFLGITRRGKDELAFDPGFYTRRDVRLDRCVLLKQHWDPNYGHWLIEGLPRIAPAVAAADCDDFAVIVTNTNRQMMQVYADSLKWFGIRPQQLRFMHNEIVEAGQLIYPTPLTVQPWIKAPAIVAILEGLADRVGAAHPGPAPKKIFINRAPSSRRQLTNADEVRAFFLDRGYTQVTPHQLTFDQQVAAFREATHVAGVLGAECVNFVFSPRGVNFLGLAPQAMQDDFFWDLASLKGGDYFCVHGAPVDPSDGMNAAFAVEPGLLREVCDLYDKP